jgi:hypothetical protein
LSANGTGAVTCIPSGSMPPSRDSRPASSPAWRWISAASDRAAVFPGQCPGTAAPGGLLQRGAIRATDAQALRPGARRPPVGGVAGRRPVHTLEELPEARDLWLMATGTALGVYLSILRTISPWVRFEHVVLVHGVRSDEDLTYTCEIGGLIVRHPESFRFEPLTTRQQSAATLHGRIPAASRPHPGRRAGPSYCGPSAPAFRRWRRTAPRGSIGRFNGWFRPIWNWRRGRWATRAWRAFC